MLNSSTDSLSGTNTDKRTSFYFCTSWSVWGESHESYLNMKSSNQGCVSLLRAEKPFGLWCWIQLSSVLYFITHTVFFWDSLAFQKEPRENSPETSQQRRVIRLNKSSVRDNDSGNSPSIPARSFSPYWAIIVMFLWCDRNTETCTQRNIPRAPHDEW